MSGRNSQQVEEVVVVQPRTTHRLLQVCICLFHGLLLGVSVV